MLSETKLWWILSNFTKFKNLKKKLGFIDFQKSLYRRVLFACMIDLNYVNYFIKESGLFVQDIASFVISVFRKCIGSKCLFMFYCFIILFLLFFFQGEGNRTIVTWIQAFCCLQNSGALRLIIVMYHDWASHGYKSIEKRLFYNQGKVKEISCVSGKIYILRVREKISW